MKTNEERNRAPHRTFKPSPDGILWLPMFGSLRWRPGQARLEYEQNKAELEEVGWSMTAK